MKKRFILIFCFLGFNLFAADFPSKLSIALKNMNKLNYNKCIFTKKTISNDLKMTEKYNGFSKNDVKWFLLEKNGKKPSNEELKKYKEKKLIESEKKKSKENRLNLSTMFKKGTVKLLKEENGKIVYSFLPENDSKEEEKMMKNVKGEVIVNKNKMVIESIILKNIKPFSPTFSVKVKLFKMEMKFKPIEEGNFYVLDTISTEMQGKLMGLKNISQKTKVFYLNYLTHN